MALLPDQRRQTTGAPQPGYGSNTGGMLTGGGEDLSAWIKQFLGQDPNGNNELGNLFRRMGFGLTPDALGRVGFQNEVGPQRLDAIRNFLSRFQPGNLQAMADQNRARLMRQGNQGADMARARVAGMGGSQDAQIGASLAARNKATDAANQYQNDLYSPMGQSAIFGQQMQGFNAAQDLNMDNLMALFNPIENRHRQNDAEQQRGGFGGMLGSIAGLAGGLDWGSILGGQSDKDKYGPFVH
jgi:hypothetical protein